MIQRYLFSALAQGLSQAKLDASVVNDLFVRNFCLLQSEADAIQQYLVEQTPTVKHGYPNNETTFPAFCIMLANENEAEEFIGNIAGTVDDPDDVNFKAEILSSIFTHVLDVFIFTENPETTAYMYELAKAIILDSTNFFADQGLFEIQVSGMDLAPDPRYFPEHALLRRLRFSCQREFTRIDPDSRGLIRSVDGVHIEGGSSSDVGGVKTLVRTYIEGFPEDDDG